MSKKSLQAAATQGVDRFFSAADNVESMSATQQVQDTFVTQVTQNTQVTQQTATEPKRRMNFMIDAAAYDYLSVMGATTRKGMSRYLVELVHKDMEENADRYSRIKEIIDNG